MKQLKKDISTSSVSSPPPPPPLSLSLSPPPFCFQYTSSPLWLVDQLTQYALKTYKQ